MKPNVYLKIIHGGVYLILLLPLFLSSQFFYPFVFPRLAIFRIIIEALLVFYLALILKDQRERPKFNSLFICLAVFMLVLLVTAFTGVDAARSFWGTMERGGGVFSWLHYFVFFVILISVFQKKEDWLKLFNISIAVSLIVSLYALGQRLGLPSLVETGVDRATGTIGNAAFLAGYLILSVGLILILLVSRINSGIQIGRQNLFWKIFYFSALLFNLIALYLTQTRGAVLGLVAGFFAFCLLELIFVKTNPSVEFNKIRRFKKYLAISLILVFFIGASVWLLRNQPLIKKIPGLARLSSISLKETTAQTRLLAWRIAWQGWQERFWLGWGPENYNLVFDKYFDSKFYQYSRGETWFDRAHNIVFDVATTSGLIGLLAYLSVFASAFWLLQRQFKRSPGLALCLVALLIAYFVQDLFVFDVFNSYLLFFLLLAYIYFLKQEGQFREQLTEKSGKKATPTIFIVFFVIVFLGLAWQFNIKPLIANWWSAQTYKLAHQPKTQEALAEPQKAQAAYERILGLYQKTLSYETYGDPEIRMEMVGFIFTQTENSQIPLSVKEPAFNFGLEQMKKSVKEHPSDSRWYLFSAKLYQAFAQVKVSGEQYPAEPLKESEGLIKKGIALSPQKLPLHYVLIQTLLMEKKYDEALERTQRLIQITPAMPENYWYLCLTHLGLQNETSALIALNQALDLAYVFQNIDDLKLAADLYARQENYSRLAAIYQQAIALDPKNLQWYASLAAVYQKLGDKEKARETALEILKIKPEAKEQVEEFLNSL